MEAVAVTATREFSRDSWAKNRLRVERGRFFSLQAIKLEAHPQKEAICSMIENKKSYGLTYKQLADRIDAMYGLKLTPKFLWRYYSSTQKNAPVFQYKLTEDQKMFNLWEQFHRLMADLEIERRARHMDFAIECALGKSLPNSYKRCYAIIKLQEDVLRLGSAIGYFPEMYFGPTGFRIIHKEDFSNYSPRLMQLLYGYK